MRSQWLTKIKLAGYTIPSIVHPSAIVSTSSTLVLVALFLLVLLYRQILPLVLDVFLIHLPQLITIHGWGILSIFPRVRA